MADSASGEDVDEDKKKDPEQIDHMPEGGDRLDGTQVRGVVSAATTAQRDDAEHDHAHEDMHEMKDDQAEIEHVEQIVRQTHAEGEITSQFEDFESTKNATEDKGRAEISAATARLAGVQSAGGADDGITARDQEEGLEQRWQTLQALFGLRKQEGMVVAGQSKTDKQGGKDEELGGDEKPDGKITRQVHSIIMVIHDGV